MIATCIALALTQDLFDKPKTSIPKWQVLAYASRAMLQTTRIDLLANRTVKWSGASRRSDKETTESGTYRLSKDKFAEISKELNEPNWKALTAQKRANPMYPSAYDGMDVVMLLNMKGSARRWSNDVYSLTADNKLLKLVAQLVPSNLKQ